MPGSENDETAIADLLYDDESRVDSLRVVDARVVLTTRRLLVVRERASPRVRAVDRANLGTVRTRTTSDRAHLLLAAQWVGLGLFLLAAWRIVPLGEFVRPIDPPPGVGFDGLFAAVNALVALLAFLDEAFLAAGVLALVWAVGRVGRYLSGRERVLEVTVAGESPITLPATASEETVDRLRTLVSSPASPGRD